MFLLSLMIVGVAIFGAKADEDQSPEYLYQWETTSFPACDEKDYFHPLFVQSNNLILRVCSATEEKLGENGSSVTYINSIDPRDKTVSCVIPDSKVVSVSSLGNGDLVLHLFGKISILNVTTCDYVTIEIHFIRSVIPHKDTISVFTYDYDQNNRLQENLSVKKYDMSGQIIEQYDNVLHQHVGEYIERQGVEMQNLDGSRKYLLFHHQRLNSSCLIHRNNCHDLAIDVLNETYDMQKSVEIDYFLKAYSSVHNKFSVCFINKEFTCIFYDHNLKPLHKNTIIDLSNIFHNYKMISMHNLLDGGAIIVVCDEKSSTECHLSYIVVNPQGQIQGRFSVDPTYSSATSDSNRHHLIGNPAFKPIIFEKDAENGIYCIVMPHTESIRGKCITVQSNEILL
ncbi:hypothetical protein QAD02_006808 [Eretmocerus hayati]|uniref:Uncharacterized protein n=1 Tax=Eretmocerus hayati TaxID=131215 RepID=A0ACC2N2R2_9HYME|nr:hypothetical protein QAD02_006808 [Eretmocerus hayati]